MRPVFERGHCGRVAEVIRVLETVSTQLEEEKGRRPVEAVSVVHVLARPIAAAAKGLIALQSKGGLLLLLLHIKGRTTTAAPA